MKGLELARRYYEDVGRPMLASQFPDYAGRVAAGLAGQGSDCLGFDDGYSEDHDWGPGFCLWLTDEDYEAVGEAMARAYDALPKTFLGRTRLVGARGGKRVGVMRTSDFCRYFIGCPGVPETPMQWLRIQEHFLATCTSGAVFEDPLGDFTAIRNGLLPCYPEDVRLKKLAARAATMAQSGQYNFPRMMRRGDLFGARLALGEFLNAALSMLYLLNFRYEPFYKWQFKGAEDLEAMSEALPYLKDIAASSTRRDEGIGYDVEAVCAAAARELAAQGLTDAPGTELEEHAYSVMARIADGTLRNLHVMEG